jgi:IS5 family transposase
MNKETFVSSGIQALKESSAWNSIEFFNQLDELFGNYNISKDKAHNRIGKAFTWYLAGNSPSIDYLQPALEQIYEKYKL